MRLSDLRDKIIRTVDGERLGRVHEVHCENGRVVALRCGPGSFFERLTTATGGKPIPWACVREVDARHVTVLLGPAPAKKPTSARSRPGTPRPSGRPSKR